MYYALFSENIKKNVALLQKNSQKEYVAIMEEIGVPGEYIEFELLEDIKFQNDKRIPEILNFFRIKIA